jgi:hypothetical protein
MSESVNPWHMWQQVLRKTANQPKVLKSSVSREIAIRLQFIPTQVDWEQQYLAVYNLISNTHISAQYRVEGITNKFPLLLPDPCPHLNVVHVSNVQKILIFTTWTDPRKRKILDQPDPSGSQEIQQFESNGITSSKPRQMFCCANTSRKIKHFLRSCFMLVFTLHPTMAIFFYVSCLPICLYSKMRLH